MKPRFNFMPWKVAGIASMALPVLVMIGLHMKWQDTFNGKMRMLLKHIGFWSGFAINGVLVHRVGFRTKPFSKALPIFLGGATLPIIGYMASQPIARRFFPKTPLQTTTTPSPKLDIREQAVPETFTIPTYNYPDPMAASRIYPMTPAWTSYPMAGMGTGWYWPGVTWS